MRWLVVIVVTALIASSCGGGDGDDSQDGDTSESGLPGLIGIAELGIQPSSRIDNCPSVGELLDATESHRLSILAASNVERPRQARLDSAAEAVVSISQLAAVSFCYSAAQIAQIEGVVAAELAIALESGDCQTIASLWNPSLVLADANIPFGRSAVVTAMSSNNEELSDCLIEGEVLPADVYGIAWLPQFPGTSLVQLQTERSLGALLAVAADPRVLGVGVCSLLDIGSLGPGGTCTGGVGADFCTRTSPDFTVDDALRLPGLSPALHFDADVGSFDPAAQLFGAPLNGQHSISGAIHAIECNAAEDLFGESTIFSGEGPQSNTIGAGCVIDMAAVLAEEHAGARSMSFTCALRYKESINPLDGGVADGYQPTSPDCYGPGGPSVADGPPGQTIKSEGDLKPIQEALNERLDKWGDPHRITDQHVRDTFTHTRVVDEGEAIAELNSEPKDTEGLFIGTHGVPGGRIAYRTDLTEGQLVEVEREEWAHALLHTSGYEASANQEHALIEAANLADTDVIVENRDLPDGWIKIEHHPPRSDEEGQDDGSSSGDQVSDPGPDDPDADKCTKTAAEVRMDALMSCLIVGDEITYKNPLTPLTIPIDKDPDMGSSCLDLTQDYNGPIGAIDCEPPLVPDPVSGLCFEAADGPVVFQPDYNNNLGAIDCVPPQLPDPVTGLCRTSEVNLGPSLLDS